MGGGFNLGLLLLLQLLLLLLQVAPDGVLPGSNQFLYLQLQLKNLLLPGYNTLLELSQLLLDLKTTIIFLLILVRERNKIIIIPSSFYFITKCCQTCLKSSADFDEVSSAHIN